MTTFAVMEFDEGQRRWVITSDGLTETEAQFLTAQKRRNHIRNGAQVPETVYKPSAEAAQWQIISMNLAGPSGNRLGGQPDLSNPAVTLANYQAPEGITDIKFPPAGPAIEAATGKEVEVGGGNITSEQG